MEFDGLKLAILLFAGVGAIWDIRTRTIPNWLTMSALFGVIFFGFVFTDHERTVYFLTLVFASLILWIPFFKKLIGGGDIKMLMVMAIASSIPNFVLILFCVAVMGGVQALLTALYFKLKKHPHPFKVPIPYGVAIFLGYGLHMLFLI
jgi:prepilin peptidase CpaA